MKARLITDNDLTEAVINACPICTIGMVDSNNMPYTLPFNFGYDKGIFYIHSGPEGQKIQVLKNNPNVCVVMSADHQMYHQSEQVACSYGMKYKSVMIRGTVEFIEDLEEKALALSIIMRHYTKREDYRYSEPSLKNVQVMKIIPVQTDCKYFGY